jgi:g-D-glutamyl-meso-diaminopimelate peptidase
VVSADNREEMVNGAPWYIRKNSRGVDLNRNFDADWESIDYSYGLSSIDPKSPTYRGPYPNSEPEVEALIKLMECVRPQAVFSYHFLCSICTDRLVSYGGAKDDAAFIDRLDEISIAYSKAFRETVGAPERRFKTTELICSAGSLIAWLYKRGIPAFDIEMSGDLEQMFPSKKDKSTPEALALATQGHKAAILKMLQFL